MSENKKSSIKVSRRAVLITGGVVLFFSFYLLVFLVPDLIKSLGGPEAMTIERAAEIATSTSKYVSITNGEWNCNSIDYVYGYRNRQRYVRYTRVLLTNSRHNTNMWVELSGNKACEDIQNMEASGYLTGGSNSLALCGYCGAQNSAIGVGFGVVILLVGLGLVVWGYRLPPASKTPEPVQPEPSSPINPPDV